jgi:hypothetical protein
MSIPHDPFTQRRDERLFNIGCPEMGHVDGEEEERPGESVRCRRWLWVQEVAVGSLSCCGDHTCLLGLLSTVPSDSCEHEMHDFDRQHHGDDGV